MSTLYISEYIGSGVTGKQAVVAGIPLAIGHEPGLDQAPITISGTQAQSAAFQATTTFIRVHTDLICSILIGNPNLNAGAGPEATTNNKRLAANQTEYFGVNPGDMLSVISNT